MINTGKKRIRGANWSDAEVSILLEFVAEHYGSLFDKLPSKKTIRQKRDLWQQATQKVNGRGGLNRPWQKVRRKWFEIKSSSLYYQSTTGINPPTENFSPPEKPWFVGAVLNIIGEDKDIIITAIEGGGESSINFKEEEPTLKDWDSQSQCDIQTSNRSQAASAILDELASGVGDVKPHSEAWSQEDASCVPSRLSSSDKGTTEALAPLETAQTPAPTESPQNSRAAQCLLGFQRKRKLSDEECLESIKAAKDRGTTTLLSEEEERAQAEKKKLALETELMQFRISAEKELMQIKINAEKELMQFRINAEKERHDMHVEILKTQAANAKMEQKKLSYELQKMETELGVASE